MIENDIQKFECSAVVNGCEIELTNHCGLNCIGCIRKECKYFGFLTFDILKSIVEIIKNKGYTEIVLSGLGDVFLHKDLYKFIDHIFKHIPKIKIYIMTKGQSVKNYDIDKILEYKLKNFNIGLTFSIFSLNKNTYHDITGGGDLDSLLNLIKYSHKKGINFSFEFLLNNINIGNVNIYKNFSKLFGKEFIYSIPHNWGGLLMDSEYRQIFNFDILNKFINKRFGGERCEAFIGKYLFFDYNGDIYKCGLKRFDKNFFLGNVNKLNNNLFISKLSYNSCINCSYYNYRTNINI
ncbi:MAG: radical SAM protein [Candidatus Gracilibacteria bacterium]|nr:radical SAM protein [Candidatus Gracilibacteria bacterium]MDD2908610.1 radical SAM protein [Candidatus Gracilibacteria bacterium]